ncbi:MAG: hypothetical protein PHU14_02080 [Methylovulum sp.]|nr:hypothetical protein [Methylovulum sp.]
MAIRHSCWWLVTSLSLTPIGANASIAEQYTLPPSKVYYETCQREAQLLHPGVVVQQQILHRHGNFLVRYEIRANGAIEWFVLCDLANGGIIREQQLIDE